MPRLDPATRNIVIGRLQAGQSQHEVARTLNVNQSTISRLWNRFQQTGSSNDRPRSGRPKKPYYGAALTPLHRHERVRWCNRLRGWPFRNWRRIWFSDYSRFLLQKRDGRIRVYRRRMNVSLPPVFRKWISTVVVVSWCGRRSQMLAKKNSCMSWAI